MERLLEFVLWAVVLSNHRWKCSIHINILFERTLRKRTHFLLISLAFADLLAGLIAVPLFIMIQANLLLHTAYWVYLCVDMITGLSSVFTLTAISLERLHAIARPLRHRPWLTLRSYAIAIATPWIFSLSLSYLLSVFSVITSLQFSCVITISLSTPLLITCISYCIIWRKQSSRIPSEAQATEECSRK